MPAPPNEANGNDDVMDVDTVFVVAIVTGVGAGAGADIGNVVVTIAAIPGVMLLCSATLGVDNVDPGPRPGVLGEPFGL